MWNDNVVPQDVFHCSIVGFFRYSYRINYEVYNDGTSISDLYSSYFF